jgi:hypothetical protein
MKAFGSMTRRMGMEFILIVMVLNMKEIGIKIYNMEMEKKHGLMDLNSLGYTVKVKRMAWVNTSGLMEHVMKENGKKMK